MFPSTGHFLAAVSNGRSFGLLRRFARAFKAGSPLPIIASPAPAGIAGVGWSDHWSFWQHGYPALLLTDTAPYRYPHYHAPSDTPDKLDYLRLAWATTGVANALRELAR
jgi:Zn-dependent M28 family amino/carboxypeptidase